MPPPPDGGTTVAGVSTASRTYDHMITPRSPATGRRWARVRPRQLRLPCGQASSQERREVLEPFGADHQAKVVRHTGHRQRNILRGDILHNDIALRGMQKYLVCNTEQRDTGADSYSPANRLAALVEQEYGGTRRTGINRTV